MLLLCSCLIILFLVVVNECYSETPEAVDIIVYVGVVVVNVDFVALLFVTGNIIFSCSH